MKNSLFLFIIRKKLKLLPRGEYRGLKFFHYANQIPNIGKISDLPSTGRAAALNVTLQLSISE